MLSAIVVSAVILNENAIAARRKSSKTTSKKGLRSASSKKSNSAKSTSKKGLRSASSRSNSGTGSTSKKGLRSASSRSNSGTGSTSGRSSRSSKRAATASAKVSNIRGLNSYSNSTYGNTTNYSYADVSDVTSLISGLTSKMKTLSETMNEYANKISNLEKQNSEYANKMSDFETRLAKLEAGSVVTTQNVPLSTSSTTTSDGKLGYIKGSADLCKPDSSGHKYCSVAINVDKKYPGSSFCISYLYDKSVNSWTARSKIFDMQTITGQINSIKDFTKNKPTLFVMDDFSYYLGDEYSRMILEKKDDRKYILLCGTGLGHNHTDTVYPTFDILDKQVKLYGYPGAYKVSNDAKGSIRHPFTSPSGDLVLFDVNGSPLIKWTGNSLEYSPNLSESYIKELKSFVRDGSNEEYFDVRGNKYSKLDW